jgi:hypothetical protein
MSGMNPHFSIKIILIHRSSFNWFLESIQLNRFNMKRLFCIYILFFCLNNIGFSQMWNGVDTLFGNEWIQYDQQYFKMLIPEDGLFRIDKQALETAGVPVNEVSSAQFKVYFMGEEVPIGYSGLFGILWKEKSFSVRLSFICQSRGRYVEHKI